jgi:GTP-binding protein
MRPLVAIVGRANVGKSTLFNRLIGRRKVIVSDIPGTTRDRLYEEVFWQGKDFDLVDTGGIVFDQKVDYEKDITKQVKEAISSTDLILFLIDIKEGLQISDKKALEEVRKSDKKIILVANKADNQKLRTEASNLANLGLGQPIAVSAIHGTSTGDLLDEIVKNLKFSKVSLLESEENITKVAIAGKPNVGKSSLFNKLIGKNQAIVSDIPGTTRDVINTKVKIGEFDYLFLDTAGLRRRTKVKKQIEYYSVLRAIRAIGESDIVLLLIDATEGVARQDLHIIADIIEKGKGLIILVNKWDLSGDTSINFYISYLQKKITFVSWAPVIFISAKNGKNISKIYELIEKVKEERTKRIKIKELNNLISNAIIKKPSPRNKKSKSKFFYTTQAKGIPPTFVIFVNKKEIVRQSFLRYLENQIRDKYEFIGTPIRIILRSKK